MGPGKAGAVPERTPETTAHPLWPVVLILGEIALRVAGRRGEGHVHPAEAGPGSRDTAD